MLQLGFLLLQAHVCVEKGKKGEGKKRHHSGQQATCHPHPTAHHPIQSHRLERRDQRVHPALFSNSFREESDNLELPGKLTDKTLMKNLIPTSTLSSGLLCCCHFLALLPLLSSLDILSPLLHATYDPLPPRFHNILRSILVFLFLGKIPAGLTGRHCTAK